MKTSRAVSSSVPSVKRLSNKSSVADNSTASAAQKGPAIFRKLDRKKPWKVEVSAPHGSSVDYQQNNDGIQLGKDKDLEAHTKPGVKRTLFSKITNETRNSVVKAGSRVVPYQDEISESTEVVSNETEDLCGNPKSCEDLSLIRKQLAQIETQQSNLLDLLQVIF